MGQAVQVPAEQHLLHLEGQTGQGFRDPGRLFVADGLGTGGTPRISQGIGQVPSRELAPQVALLALITPEHPQGRANHNATQPNGQLGHGLAAERDEAALHLHEPILNQIEVIHPSP